jgi:alpha-1,3-mannosyltransferase
MKRFTLSIGQTLVLLFLLALVAVQQVHKQPLVDTILRGLNSVSNDTVTQSGHLDSGVPLQPPFTPAPRLDQTNTHSQQLSTEFTAVPSYPDPESFGVQRSGDGDAFISPQILQVDCPDRQADASLMDKAEEIVASIMGSRPVDIPRLQCPPLDEARYTVLSKSFPSTKLRYFFAMNLHQSAHILAQLFGAILEAVKVLGPERCAISVVEGRSTDGTFEILRSLVKDLERLGTSFYLSCSDLQPGGEGSERISALAELRNLALRPLTVSPTHFDATATVIFLNDIAPCTEDLLELILQRVALGADMTCGMDWYNLQDGSGTFYDSWIGRQMNGEPFFEVPQSTSWDFSKNLFWNHPASKLRYSVGLPLQVFSCWNGAVAMAAKPFIDGDIRFRTQHEGECHLGEPVHLAKDLWRHGHGKIAVIPSVNVAYSVDDSSKAKEAHGSVSSLALKSASELTLIEWQEKPPGQIKCLEEVFHKQSWEPFDLSG